MVSIERQWYNNQCSTTDIALCYDSVYNDHYSEWTRLIQDHLDGYSYCTYETQNCPIDSANDCNSCEITTDVLNNWLTGDNDCPMSLTMGCLSYLQSNYPSEREDIQDNPPDSYCLSSCSSHSSLSCYADDLYWFDSCGNREDLYQDCGYDNCGLWGQDFCENGDVYHSRTCYDRGCSGNGCFTTPYSDKELVEECSNGCSDGSCNVEIICDSLDDLVTEVKKVIDRQYNNLFECMHQYDSTDDVYCEVYNQNLIVTFDGLNGMVYGSQYACNDGTLIHGWCDGNTHHEEYIDCIKNGKICLDDIGCVLQPDICDLEQYLDISAINAPDSAVEADDVDVMPSMSVNDISSSYPQISLTFKNIIQSDKPCMYGTGSYGSTAIANTIYSSSTPTSDIDFGRPWLTMPNDDVTVTMDYSYFATIGSDSTDNCANSDGQGFIHLGAVQKTIESIPDCTSHASYSCHNNNVYWYDSCGNPEAVKESCPNLCEGNMCIDCNQGVCCDTYNKVFRDSSWICKSNEKEYGCPEGTSHGDDVYRRYVTQWCSGDSANCEGRIDATTWKEEENCRASDDEYCEWGGRSVFVKKNLLKPQRLDAKYYFMKLYLEEIKKSGANIKTLSEVATITQKRINPSRTPEKEFYYLEVPDISEGIGMIGNIRKVKGKYINGSKVHFKAGDILFTRLYPDKNRIIIVPEEIKEGVCSDEIYLIRPKDQNEINSYVLLAALKSSMVTNQVRDLISGSSSSRPRLKDKDLQSIIIPILTSEENDKIAKDMKKIVQNHWNACQNYLEKYKNVLSYFGDDLKINLVRKV